MTRSRAKNTSSGRTRRRVALAFFGVLLIGAVLAPSSLAAGPRSPAGSFSNGPTPTPIAGLPKHG